MDQKLTEQPSEVTTRPETAQNNKFQDLAELDAKIPKNMMMTYQGKPYVLKSGLEFKASQVFGIGKYSLTTEIVERTEERIVVKASLLTPSREIFINYGEVNKFNTNKLMFNNALHLAVTRAECRVLRMATACGYVSFEEIEGQDSVKEIPVSETDNKPATDAQKQTIETLKGEVKKDMNQAEAKAEIARLL